MVVILLHLVQKYQTPEQNALGGGQLTRVFLLVIG